MDRRELEAILRINNKELQARRIAREVGRSTLGGSERERQQAEEHLKGFKILLWKLGPAGLEEQRNRPAEVRIHLGSGYAEQFGGNVEYVAVVRAHTPGSTQSSFWDVGGTPPSELGVKTTFSFGPPEYPTMHELGAEYLNTRHLPEDPVEKQRLLLASFDTLDMLSRCAADPVLNPQFSGRIAQSQPAQTP